MTSERVVWDQGADEQATFGEHNGCADLPQTILRVIPGPGTARSSGERADVLFVLEGSGRLDVDGGGLPLEPETGVYIPPGRDYLLVCSGPPALALVCASVPHEGDAAAARAATVGLAEQEAGQATAGRDFRLVVTPAAGCTAATQFIGAIPPGRAPDHYHHYDEVLYVLEGEGVLHVEGEEDRHVRPGACIHLSPRLVHSLENSGAAPMRVLGVFCPAGSPAEAYYPDGTLAMPG